MNRRDDALLTIYARTKSVRAAATGVGMDPLQAYALLRAYNACPELKGWKDGKPPKSGGRAPGVIGKKFEDLVRADLYDRGWGWVLRSHMSKGAQDLIAFSPSRTTWFVQCKKHGVITPEERLALIDLANKAGAQAILAKPGADEPVEYWQLVDRRTVIRRDPKNRAEPQGPGSGTLQSE